MCSLQQGGSSSKSRSSYAVNEGEVPEFVIRVRRLFRLAHRCPHSFATKGLASTEAAVLLGLAPRTASRHRMLVGDDGFAACLAQSPAAAPRCVVIVGLLRPNCVHWIDVTAHRLMSLMFTKYALTRHFTELPWSRLRPDWVVSAVLFR